MYLMDLTSIRSEVFFSLSSSDSSPSSPPSCLCTVAIQQLSDSRPQWKQKSLSVRIRNLYPGVGAAVMSSMVFGSIYMVVYELTKVCRQHKHGSLVFFFFLSFLLLRLLLLLLLSFFSQILHLNVCLSTTQAKFERLIPKDLSWLTVTIATIFGNSVLSIFEAPLDTIKQRMQTGLVGGPAKLNFFNAMVWTVRNEGAASLYVGFFPYVAKTVPFEVRTMQHDKRMGKSLEVMQRTSLLLCRVYVHSLFYFPSLGEKKP